MIVSPTHALYQYPHPLDTLAAICSVWLHQLIILPLVYFQHWLLLVELVNLILEILQH